LGHQQGVLKADVFDAVQLARKLKLPALPQPDADGPQVLQLGLPGARWGWMQSLAAPNFTISPLDERSVRIVWRSYVGLDDCELYRSDKGLRLRMGKSACAKVRHHHSVRNGRVLTHTMSRRTLIMPYQTS
jgi:hypothetical protein